MIEKMKQSGENKKYPMTILVWDLKGNNPDWLVDVCKVKSISEDGIEILDIVETTSGGLIYKSSDGRNSVVDVKDKNDYVLCKDIKSSKIISLNHVQLHLLYERE